MSPTVYHVLRQEPTPVEPEPVDKITWVYVTVAIVPVIFACCGIMHYIRTYRRKQLQANKPVDIEMGPGELKFAQDDWEDDPKLTKVTGNPNSVWNQLESVTTEQLGASAKRGGPWQPTPDVYGFGDSATNDHGTRYGNITRTKTDSDLVQPPSPVANPVRLSKGESDVLRSVVDAPAPDEDDEEDEPSPTRSSWTTCRPTSSVYSVDYDDEELPLSPSLPVIDEHREADFSKMDDEINRIINTRVLTPSKRGESHRSTDERPANPRSKSESTERSANHRSKSHDRSRTRRKRPTKPEYGNPKLVQGGWERKKKDSERRHRRRSPSGAPSEGHRQGKPIKKEEKPAGWFDKMADKVVERIVTGGAKLA